MFFKKKSNPTKVDFNKLDEAAKSKVKTINEEILDFDTMKDMTADAAIDSKISFTKPADDANKFHIVALKDLCESVDDEEAATMIKVLVKRYPDIIFSTLLDEFESMKGTIDTITTSINCVK